MSLSSSMKKEKVGRFLMHIASAHFFLVSIQSWDFQVLAPFLSSRSPSLHNFKIFRIFLSYMLTWSSINSRWFLSCSLCQRKLNYHLSAGYSQFCTDGCKTSDKRFFYNEKSELSIKIEKSEQNDNEQRTSAALSKLIFKFIVW